MKKDTLKEIKKEKKKRKRKYKGKKQQEKSLDVNLLDIILMKMIKCDKFGEINNPISESNNKSTQSLIDKISRRLLNL